MGTNLAITTKVLRLTRGFRYFVDSLTYRLSSQSGGVEAYKNRYAGKTLLVVGNGPSLNDTPLDAFVGVPSIGMNKINLIYDRTRWRPSVVVCTNNLVVMQNHKQMARSGVECLLAWKSRWFVERSLRSSFGYFLNLNTDQFSYDLSEGLSGTATVTYVALQLAAYMGEARVILLGVDHGFSRSGEACDVQVREGQDVNHFHPDYFASGQRWGVPNMQGSELAYRNARDAYSKLGIEILDATVNGKLKVFPKISIQEAIKHVRNEQ